MKVWVMKKDLQWLKEMQDEARTRQIEISSFKRFKGEEEVDVTMTDTNKINIDFCEKGVTSNTFKKDKEITQLQAKVDKLKKEIVLNKLEIERLDATLTILRTEIEKQRKQFKEQMQRLTKEFPEITSFLLKEYRIKNGKE